LLAFKINMMVGIKDVAAMAPDEISDIAHQPLAICTLHQQGGGSSLIGPV
jgi:hypothetical protein